MIRKLSEKFPGERGTILQVIGEMERVQLLSDHRFTEEFLHHLIQKPIGRFKIMMECKKRGLDPDMVEQALLDAEWNEEKAIKEAITEKERVLHEKDERKHRQKLVNFLKNRGFSDRNIFRELA